MPKKQKKNVYVKPTTNKDKIQIDIKKSLEDDKNIKPEKVFENYSKEKPKKKPKSKKKY
tara:strand:- start:1844 stop:2020 length:177 start_codon:yes stop_codon:yes gene_type:complete